MNVFSTGLRKTEKRKRSDTMGASASISPNQRISYNSMKPGICKMMISYTDTNKPHCPQKPLAKRPF